MEGELCNMLFFERICVDVESNARVRLAFKYAITSFAI